MLRSRGGPRTWAAVVATGVVLVLLGSSGAFAPAGPEGRAPAALVPETSTTGLYYHANISAAVAPPNGTTPNGELIGAEYQVSASSLPAAAGPQTVRVPAVQISIPTTNGLIHLYYGATNLTVNGSATSTGSPGPSVLFAQPLTFPPTPNAVLSTQGLAAMASWPFGSSSLVFRWQWILDAPDGRITPGPWSSPATVVPAGLVLLTLPSGHAWPDGTSLSICASGPTAGVTFSAHVSTTNPASVYVTSTVTAPTTQSGPYCWSNNLPAGLAPQSASIHLWEFTNESFMLAVIPIQLVGASAASPGGGSGGVNPSWPVYVAVGVVAIIVGGVLVAWWAAPDRVRSFLPARFQHGRSGPPDGAMGASTRPTNVSPPPPPPPGTPPA